MLQDLPEVQVQFVKKVRSWECWIGTAVCLVRGLFAALSPAFGVPAFQRRPSATPTRILQKPVACWVIAQEAGSKVDSASQVSPFLFCPYFLWVAFVLYI